jgi:hypothetical protein
VPSYDAAHEDVQVGRRGGFISPCGGGRECEPTSFTDAAEARRVARLGSHGLDVDYPLARPIMAVTMPPLAPVANEVPGPASQITDGSLWAPAEGQTEFYALLAQASGVRAGTSAILPNILGERVLGLPKD